MLYPEMILLIIVVKRQLFVLLILLLVEVILECLLQRVHLIGLVFAW